MASTLQADIVIQNLVSIYKVSYLDIPRVIDKIILNIHTTYYNKELQMLQMNGYFRKSELFKSKDVILASFFVPILESAKTKLNTFKIILSHLVKKVSNYHFDTIDDFPI